MKVAQCTCGAKFDVSTYAPGAKLKCAKCKSIFVVPEDGAEESASPQAVESATRTTAPAKSAEGSAASAAGTGAGKTTRVTRTTRTATRSRPSSGGTKPIGSRSSGSYRPAAKSSTGLYLTLGSGAIALVLVVVFAVVLSKKGNESRPGGGGGGNGGGVDDGKSLEQRIIDKVNPHDARGWVLVADNCKNNRLSDAYEKYLEKACQMDPKDEEVSNRYGGLLEGRAQALNTHADDYADKLFQIGLQAKKVGLEKLAGNIFTDIVGEPPRKKGICPKHPGANKELGRRLTIFGDYDDAEMADDLEKRSKDSESERKMLEGMKPWQKNAYMKKKEIESKVGSKCQCVSEQPYLIVVQESPAFSAEIIAEDFRKVAEHLYQLFRKEYADKFQISELFQGEKAEKVLPIIVYDSRDTYVKKNPGIPEWAGGHFSPGDGYIQMFKDTGKPYETVFHEGTHQLVAAACELKGGKATDMFWFTEGIATFFEDFKRDENGDFVIGIKSRQYLPPSQQAIKAKKFVPLKTILAQSYLKFQIEQSSIGDPFQRQAYVIHHYAESWSIVYFFYTYDNGKYKEKFNQYFQDEINGKGNFEDVQKIFGDLDALEKEWAAYIGEMKPD